jgi:hypothetical protein
VSDTELQAASVPIALPSATSAYGDKILNLSKSVGGTGMWVPYQANSTVYGNLTGGQTWAASGPYSGCYFVVGRHDGKIFVAHVSCENQNDANVNYWDSKSGMTGDILFKKKIGMAANLPKGATNAAAIVFASVAGGTVSATRIDVKTSSAGGMSGLIFNVEALVSD